MIVTPIKNGEEDKPQQITRKDYATFYYENGKRYIYYLNGDCFQVKESLGYLSKNY